MEFARIHHRSAIHVAPSTHVAGFTMPESADVIATRAPDAVVVVRQPPSSATEQDVVAMRTMMSRTTVRIDGIRELANPGVDH